MFPFGTTGGRPGAFYQIDRSLRFNDDDSAYLSRTPGSAGNRKTWTWSGWVKRGNLGTGQVLLGRDENGSGQNWAQLNFDSSDRLNFINYSTVTVNVKTSTDVFRDPSAWYHILCVFDTSNGTAADRIRLYVNNRRITSFASSTDPSLNYDGYINEGSRAHSIGSVFVSSRVNYFDGYLAEVHFVDGTALDPTSFGEFDTNGVWRPIKVSGLTYGTNGFYLSFADNTSTTTLGYDDAGSNDWTLNNFSVMAGAGNDSLEDTPTNNWCVLNNIDSGIAPTNGNLTFASGTAAWRIGRATISIPESFKAYWEVALSGASTNNFCIGIDSGSSLTTLLGAASTGWGIIPPNATGSTAANKYHNVVSTSATLPSNSGTDDVYMFAVDRAAAKIWVGINGNWIGTVDASGELFSGLPTTGNLFPAVSVFNTTVNCNFGQRPFAYTPPTGYSALCTANLPTPDIADPGSYMNAVTYTGTGSSQSITGVGFQPDLVWIKGRSGATDHALYDSTRGVEKQLESNTTTDETTEATGLTAFGSDGFTVGALAQVNTSAATYVGWCWKEGVTPGFDVVTYTGTGVARTISHNLGTVPKLIIVKARSTASTDQGWPVYHASNTTAPETDYLLLNSTAATADLNTVWNDTAPTTTVFSVGTNALVNTLNDTYVAYLFAEVEGFSKFGSYTGNGSADGPFVWAAFRPRYVFIKLSSGAGESWIQFDAARSSSNVVDDYFLLNGSSAEAVGSSAVRVDFLANGFKIRGSDTSINTSGQTYIFAAFAEQPFSAPANAR